jgi:hypothetical protein
MTPDEHMWKAATWSTPFAIQVVIAVTAVAAWLLGAALGMDDDAGRRTVLLIATAIAVTMSVAFGAVLFTRPTPQPRGIGLSLLASAVVVLIGGVGLAVTFF